MKTMQITRLYTEPVCSEQKSTWKKSFSLFTETLTIFSFTRWGKSIKTGNSGAAGLFLGHSTFGGTGRLYPLYGAQPATLSVHGNRQALQMATKNACTVISLMSYTLNNNNHAK
jgi:hypothetical protein